LLFSFHCGKINDIDGFEMPFKSVEAPVKQLALYSIDKALKKYIANNAENCFHTDKVLIIS